MTYAIPDHGCDIGTDPPRGEAPWPTGWEQTVDDTCAHHWEVVTVALGWRDCENVVRCATCHVPRCGHWSDENPCMERRHHDGLHLFLDGSFNPVGGMLGPES